MRQGTPASAGDKGSQVVQAAQSAAKPLIWYPHTEQRLSNKYELHPKS